MRLTLAITTALALAVTACGKDEGDDSATTDEQQTDEDVPEDDESARRSQPPKKIPPPDDVAEPPEEAETTDSGLAYLVLQEGSGDEKPGANDVVEVKWTGWKSGSGTMVYTTERRGEPVDISLSQASPGWREGLQMMPVGDKRRFWMSPELAYPKSSRTPQKGREAMTIDVELVGIKRAPEPPEHLGKAPANAKKTDSGLAYRLLAKGSGEPVGETDTAKVHYSAWDDGGRMLDSTVTGGEPRTVPATKAPGWMKPILMKLPEGGKARVWVPRDQLPRKLPGGADSGLTYDIEVLEIQRGKEPPPAPKNVAAPPDDAQKTDKGVFYQVLSEGSGSESPTLQDTFVAHYTGWTTDGQMFDSSVTRGEPLEAPLGRMIEGWKDAIPRMTVGDRWRLWIPEELAYQGRPGRPAGMLVFDVELLDIK